MKVLVTVVWVISVAMPAFKWLKLVWH